MLQEFADSFDKQTISPLNSPKFDMTLSKPMPTHNEEIMKRVIDTANNDDSDIDHSDHDFGDEVEESDPVDGPGRGPGPASIPKPQPPPQNGTDEIQNNLSMSPTLSPVHEPNMNDGSDDIIVGDSDIDGDDDDMDTEIMKMSTSNANKKRSRTDENFHDDDDDVKESPSKAMKKSSASNASKAVTKKTGVSKTNGKSSSPTRKSNTAANSKKTNQSSTKKPSSAKTVTSKAKPKQKSVKPKSNSSVKTKAGDNKKEDNESAENQETEVSSASKPKKTITKSKTTPAKSTANGSATKKNSAVRTYSKKDKEKTKESTTGVVKKSASNTPKKTGGVQASRTATTGKTKGIITPKKKSLVKTGISKKTATSAGGVKVSKETPKKKKTLVKSESGSAKKRKKASRKVEEEEEGDSDEDDVDSKVDLGVDADEEEEEEEGQLIEEEDVITPKMKGAIIGTVACSSRDANLQSLLDHAVRQLGKYQVIDYTGDQEDNIHNAPLRAYIIGKDTKRGWGVLRAIANGIPLVDESWLTQSISDGKWVDLYAFRSERFGQSSRSAAGDGADNKDDDGNVTGSNSSQQKILEGMRVGVWLKDGKESANVRKVITACGGRVAETRVDIVINDSSEECEGGINVGKKWLADSVEAGIAIEYEPYVIGKGTTSPTTAQDNSRADGTAQPKAAGSTAGTIAANG